MVACIYLFIAAIIPKAFDIQEGKSQDESQLSSVFSSVVGRPVPEPPRGGAQVILRPGWGAGAVRKRPTPRS